MCSSSKIEDDEWMVLNREPNGLLKLDPMAVDVPMEIRVGLEPRAQRLSWDTLRQYRFDSHREFAKMPLLQFRPIGGNWYPWPIEKAIELTRWWHKRKNGGK